MPMRRCRGCPDGSSPGARSSSRDPTCRVWAIFPIRNFPCSGNPLAAEPRQLAGLQAAAAASDFGQKAPTAFHPWHEAATVLQLGQNATAAPQLRQDVPAAQCDCRFHLSAVEAVTPAVDQQRAEPPPLKLPVAHRPRVDVEKTGMRVPADAAALHPPGRLHCVLEPRPKMDVESAAIEMLAVIGDAKG